MFDSRLRLLREEKLLTRKDVALDLKIPYTTYNSYENDEREPSSEILIKIADYFDVSVDYLLGLTSIKSKKEDFKTINAITGLSEKAIDRLSFIKTQSNDEKEIGNNVVATKTDILNNIIENPYLDKFLSSIANYGESKLKFYKHPEKSKRWDIDFEDKLDDFEDAIKLLRKNNLHIIDNNDHIDLEKFKMKDSIDTILFFVIRELFTKDAEEQYEKKLLEQLRNRTNHSI